MDTRRLNVSKVSAARRQLDCAIELWFLDSDDVSIHTLAAAAHQIIHDINQKKGGGRDLLYDSAVIKVEYQSMRVALIKKPVNFFKHADNDADKIIEFTPYSSLLFCFFLSLVFRAIGELTNDVEDTLTMWIIVHEPSFVKEDFRNRMAKGIPINLLAHLNVRPTTTSFAVGP